MVTWWTLVLCVAVTGHWTVAGSEVKPPGYLMEMYRQLTAGGAAAEAGTAVHALMPTKGGSYAGDI